MYSPCVTQDDVYRTPENWPGVEMPPPSTGFGVHAMGFNVSLSMIKAC